MSTVLVTRTQFEYSIVAEFADYASKIADRLMLTEVKEQELRKFKLSNSCHKAIRWYFSRYDGDNPPSDGDKAFSKAEIESIVTLFNTVVGSNYWYEFPED